MDIQLLFLDPKNKPLFWTIKSIYIVDQDGQDALGDVAAHAVQQSAAGNKGTLYLLWCIFQLYYGCSILYDIFSMPLFLFMFPFHKSLNHSSQVLYFLIQ